MKTIASATDTIVTAACSAIGDLGLQALTVGVVAERAGVSTALIHYHFDTKAHLLVAATSRLAAARTERRLAALGSGKGLAALDALWASIELGVREGSERAYLELVMHARTDATGAAALHAARGAERKALVRRLPPLMRELGAAAEAGSEEIAAALDAQLDGLALALLAGQDPGAVRNAYDAFWLALLAAGQTRRR